MSNKVKLCAKHIENMRQGHFEVTITLPVSFFQEIQACLVEMALGVVEIIGLKWQSQHDLGCTIYTINIKIKILTLWIAHVDVRPDCAQHHILRTGNNQ